MRFWVGYGLFISKQWLDNFWIYIELDSWHFWQFHEHHLYCQLISCKINVYRFNCLILQPPFYSRDTAEMYDNILYKPLRMRTNVSASARSLLEGVSNILNSLQSARSTSKLQVQNMKQMKKWEPLCSLIKTVHVDLCHMEKA